MTDKNIIFRFSNPIFLLVFVEFIFSISYGIIYFSSSIYLIQILKLPDSTGYNIVSLFISINGAIHMVSGWLGARFISYKNIIIISLIMQSIACVILSTHCIFFMYLGLTLFTVFYGLIVTSLNMLIENQFDGVTNKSHLLSAYTLNYIFLNVGMFLGAFISGFFHTNFTNLFYFGAITNMLALIFFLATKKHVKQRYSILINTKNIMIFLSVILFLLPFTYLLFMFDYIAVTLIFTFSLFLIISIFIAPVFNKQIANKQNWMSFCHLALISLVFWACYYTFPISIVEFLNRTISTSIFGFPITGQWIAGINCVIIACFSPLFTYIRVRKNLGFYQAILLSFVLLLVSFFILMMGFVIYPHTGLSISWLILFIMIFSIAEIILIPYGLSSISFLIPESKRGLIMGLFLFITGSSSAAVAGFLARLFVPSDIFGVTPLNTYFKLFVAIFIIILITLIFVKFISKKRLIYIDNV